MLKLIICMGLLVLPVIALADSCKASDADLQKAIIAVHEKQRNVGVGVVIRSADGEIFSDYVGLSDLENEVRVTAATQFGIASITKLYTATLLLIYEATGRIDLDASVQSYVSDFPVKAEGDITVRMLATHKSGIPHPQAVRTPKLFATHYATAAAALEVFEDDALLFAPGSEESYSSSNYNLIAAVIEAVGARPFTEVMAEQIFDPLGLSATSFDDVSRVLPFRARRYSFYRAWDYVESDELYTIPMWDYSFNTGGGNITSTASDLARFGTELISPGLLKDQQLDTIYSWFGSGDAGHFIYASGANPGLQAGLSIHPDAGLVVAVLSNTWGKGSRSGEMTQLANKLSTLCIGTDKLP
jgi:serine beta-lactamase-like protein LACTB